MADNNRHKCKLCSRTFSNGRSLGGHMKAHLASLPSPPSPSPSSSFSSSSFSSQEKPLSNYVLQKKRNRNPTRKSEPDATEEDVAMWLVLLSRDHKWKNKKGFGFGEIKGRRCDTCQKTFRSSRALETHKNICSSVNINDNNKIFECPFCYKVFGSGQALGGHKRSHLVVPSSNNVNIKDSFIDLNLPAPADDDEISVVSDA